MEGLELYRIGFHYKQHRTMTSLAKKLIIVFSLMLCSCVDSIHTSITNESYNRITISVFVNKDFVKFTGEQFFVKLSERNDENLIDVDSSNLILTYAFESEETLNLDFGIRQGKQIMIFCDSLLLIRESDSILMRNEEIQDFLFVDETEIVEEGQTKDFIIKDEYFDEE